MPMSCVPPIRVTLRRRIPRAHLKLTKTATQVVIDAELAYACLKTVPNHQEPASRLLSSLRTYLEFQSTKEYLRDPPSGYLFSGVDLDAGLDDILEKVKGGRYDSEYDMQADIVGLLAAAHDGNLYWSGDLMGTFTFTRSENLVMVSSDGEQTPQMYISSDLIRDNIQGNVVPVTGYTPSPVESIDSVDVVSFLLSQSLTAPFNDPDAQWNGLLGGPFRSGTFASPSSYSGSSTNVTFLNGTTREYRNIAVVNVALDGVSIGDDAYNAFCPRAQDTAIASGSVRKAVSSSTESGVPSSSPTILGHAQPVIKHGADSVAGYYLDEPGLTDIAILRVNDFRPRFDTPAGYEKEFQTVVQKFFDAAVRTGKRRLILDLQGNLGGFVDLGTDLFTQLFPSTPPNSKSNMRDHLGLWALANVASLDVSAAELTADTDNEHDAKTTYVPLAFQTIVDPQFHNFADLQSFYGPQPLHGGQFTSFFQNNYTDPVSSDYHGQGLVVTGTNNRTGFRQPFAPHDIVVLTDGLCAGTCTVFSELLKTYGHVQFIVIGGRPQQGPMQAIGGVKGAQGFDQEVLASWVDLFHSPQNMFLNQANGTIWENFTTELISRANGVGVNGRNHFRMGDDTQTPLQFVYEAADCRMWWTHEMLYDPSFLWARVARMAFKDRRGTQFNSRYCVTGSTGHATSISGGWKKGTLGPQDPPPKAKATIKGWKLDGRPLGSEVNAAKAEL
ncbi:hypothetical protein A1O1_05344 [Capronia coronata CBS 617.96]|uniref:CPAF-like PDZ domain-containing protein n=1 Tax=Capronia coronata CBS 617.96 TaxID=1182541 RepID=W9Z1N3_9EURO|nr:uncharacterized protein A1O1_05344 [Capronia coronata CBS 617.96]EXJ88414.1 hypothetical protein A1O1_05344 [Capronia coronata CBS 617.96]